MKQNYYKTPRLLEHSTQLRMSILAGSINGNGAFNGSKYGGVDTAPGMSFGAKYRSKTVD
jgi:hypothetical protein